MSCKQEEKRILLAEAGELAPREMAALVTHLAACAGCRAFRDALRRFDAVARAQQAAVTFPAFLGVRVLADAEQYRQARRMRHLRAVSFLARAAAVAMLLGAAGGAGVYGHWQRQANRTAEIAGVLSVLIDEEGAHHPAMPGDRKGLARDLLRLEGLDEDLSGDDLLSLADDEPTEDDLSDEDLLDDVA